MHFFAKKHVGLPIISINIILTFMKFKANSKLDTVYFGIILSLIVAFIVTSIIINSNSETLGLFDYYSHFFDMDNNGKMIRAAVMSAMKGGGLANLFIFFLFLNRKMMRAAKGTMGVVVVLGLIIVWGVLS